MSGLIHAYYSTDLMGGEENSMIKDRCIATQQCKDDE